MAPTQATTNWADDVDDDNQHKNEDYIDKDGIRTVIEYKRNDANKLIKVTRRSRLVKVSKTVSTSVAARKTWSKFGAEAGKTLGVIDRASTTTAEPVTIKLKAGSKGGEEEVDEEEQEKENLRKALASKQITCRLCKGDHFTNRCPFKDQLGADVAGLNDNDADAPTASGPAASSSTNGKYVPPSMREGAGKGRGETMYGRSGLSRDDYPTLRVTNLSEDADEADLWELFSRFQTRARIQRIYVGKDQETGLCKGFAFVSFEDKRDAEEAMGKIDGKPYDHLILSCGWSVPRGDRPAA